MADEESIQLPSARVITRVGVLRGLGTLMIGASALITSIVVWSLVDNNNDLRQENACRFDVSTEVDSIADNIDALTAEIFVAAIRDPGPPTSPDVVRLGHELDEEVHMLRPAIEERARAVENCQE